MMWLWWFARARYWVPGRTAWYVIAAGESILAVFFTVIAALDAIGGRWVGLAALTLGVLYAWTSGRAARRARR